MKRSFYMELYEAFTKHGAHTAIEEIRKLACNSPNGNMPFTKIMDELHVINNEMRLKLNDMWVQLGDLKNSYTILKQNTTSETYMSDLKDLKIKVSEFFDTNKELNTDENKAFFGV